MRQWNNHKFICNLTRTTKLWIDESRRNGRKRDLTTKVVKKILCNHLANHFIKIQQKQQKKISFNWLRTMQKHWRLLCKMSKRWNNSEKLKWPLKPYEFPLSVSLSHSCSFANSNSVTFSGADFNECNKNPNIKTFFLLDLVHTVNIKKVFLFEKFWTFVNFILIYLMCAIKYV